MQRVSGQAPLITIQDEDVDHRHKQRRARFAAVYEHHLLIKLFRSLTEMLNVLVIVLYVVQSYQGLDKDTAGSLFSRGFRWEDYTIVTAVLFFLVDWLMRFYSAANRKYFCLTFDTFVDMITILPVVVELAGQIDDLSYFRQFQLWRLFRILRSRTPSVLYIGDAQNRDYVAHEISKLIAFVCITLSISAACFMEIENRLSGLCWGDCIDVKRDPPITIF